MANGWKIIASRDRAGGGPPMKEYYVAAYPSRQEAIAEIKKRKELFDAELTVAGEASDDFLEFLDVRGGEIFCILAVS